MAFFFQTIGFLSRRMAIPTLSGFLTALALGSQIGLHLASELLGMWGLCIKALSVLQSR
jgi:hypothetical protein